jgi:hypothetical protein
MRTSAEICQRMDSFPVSLTAGLVKQNRADSPARFHSPTATRTPIID